MFSPREARKDFLYTKLATIILLLAVSGGIAAWGFQQGVEYGLIALSPSQSQGRVLTVVDDARTVRITFEYEDEQLIRRLGDLRQRKRFALPLREGEDVAVRYLSFLPEVAQLERQLSRQAISFYILVGCFLFHVAAATAMLRTARQIRRHAAEEVYY